MIITDMKAAADEMTARHKAEERELGKRYSEAREAAFHPFVGLASIEKFGIVSEECGAASMARAMECEIFNAYAALEQGCVYEAQLILEGLLFHGREEEKEARTA